MVEDHSKLAALLRRAASQTIPEDEFWTEFNALSERLKDPVVEVALESATHYWGNFHKRSIFLFPLKPNRGQLEQGRNELNLIAYGLEAGWELPEFGEEIEGHLIQLAAGLAFALFKEWAITDAGSECPSVTGLIR
jgi:hypothetical protein